MSGPPAYGADYVSPQGLYTVGPDGSITGITLPLAFASTSIRWVRQSDGAVIATLQGQQFGSAPNRQDRLLITASEPVDAGANVGADIQLQVSAGGTSFARELLGVFPGIYGAIPKSDFLLQERMIFSVWSGSPTGFIIDNNFRIYQLGGGIQFQNSSISGENPWSVAGRITAPHTGGYIYWAGTQGGVSGTQIAVGVSINGAIVPPMSMTTAAYNTNAGGANASDIAFVRSASGDVIQWSGFNTNTTPTAFLGLFAVPFDGAEL